MVLTAGDGDDLEYFFSDWDVFYKSSESTNKSLSNNLNLTRVWAYSLKFFRHNVTSLMIMICWWHGNWQQQTTWNLECPLLWTAVLIVGCNHSLRLILYQLRSRQIFLHDLFPCWHCGNFLLPQTIGQTAEKNSYKIREKWLYNVYFRWNLQINRCMVVKLAGGM